MELLPNMREPAVSDDPVDRMEPPEDLATERVFELLAVGRQVASWIALGQTDRGIAMRFLVAGLTLYPDLVAPIRSFADVARATSVSRQRVDTLANEFADLLGQRSERHRPEVHRLRCQRSHQSAA